MNEGDHWRCKICGMLMTNKDFEESQGYCWECRNE